MATQENSSGLLSKVAKFVRNPTTDWSDLDASDSVQEAESAKQALKKMLDRKRRNDTVRKSEFDELRKLRSAAPPPRAEGAEESSLFPGATDYFDLDERATTLKKIDEIESQMSQQWWRGPAKERVPDERGAPAVVSPVAAPAPLAPPDLPPTFAPTQAFDALPLDEVMTTQMVPSGGDDFSQTNFALAASVSNSLSSLDSGSDSIFSPSKMVSMDRGQSLSDPVLEEAAIRFANGDDEGTEAVLQEALHVADATPEAIDAWADVLFDFYRCTGQRAAFDRFAEDCAQRFARPAPVWLAIQSPGASRQGTVAEPASTDFVNTQTAGTDAKAVTGHLTLSGELLGDCEPLLASFQAQMPPHACLIVSCRQLIRVDFSAAGSLLNWVVQVESGGGRVELHEVPRLVAAFFNLIGINEYAQVIARAN